MATKTNINAKMLLTSEIKSLVADYLAKRVIAETLREQVDDVYNAILAKMDLREEDEPEKRITEHKRMWLASDEDFLKVCAIGNVELRAAGIKPANMADEYCPALVAEREQSDAEYALIQASGKPFGITNDKLLCTAPGLETRQKWIDLVVGLVLAAEREGIRAEVA